MTQELNKEDYLLFEIVGFLSGLSNQPDDVGKHIAAAAAKYHERMLAYIERKKNES